jgi:uncharacterized protein YggE
MAFARHFALLVAAAAVCFGALAGTCPALAAGAEGGNGRAITVTGSGEAKARPTVVEMNAVVSGEAELAADAVVKYKDNRRRAVKAIDDLKIPSLAIESKGYTLSQGIDANQQQMMMRGQMVTSAKQRVQVTEPLRIVIKDVDRMKDDEVMTAVLKVVDAGRDAGLTIGSAGPQNYYQMQMMMQRGDTSGGGMASFKITDPAALREKAYEKAIASARDKAQRLAALAGVKLGPVTSVQDGPAAVQPGQVVYQGMPQAPDAEVTSPVAGDITMSVRLTVQFAIE